MDKLDGLFTFLNIDLLYSNKMYYGACPIHGGDKYNALNLFHNGNSYRGNWKCHTLQCEKHFRNSIIGFVRGVLSHQKYNWKGPGDKYVTFNETISFLLDFLDEDYNKLKVDYAEVERNRFIKDTAALNQYNKPTSSNKLTRPQIRNSLSIPASYYLQRGYTQKVLDKYDVGLCKSTSKPMYNRVVVPIYDNNHHYMVGCTGRSINGNTPKWLHSKGFKGENYLYNYWSAKKHILQQRTAIIVESPGNVWRLEEAGIYNSVALFGTALSVGQRVLLDGSGALSLILLTDNDSAGKLAIETIREQCERAYYIHTPNIAENRNDIGEMDVTEIQETLTPQINKIISSL